MKIFEIIVILIVLYMVLDYFRKRDEGTDTTDRDGAFQAILKVGRPKKKLFTKGELIELAIGIPFFIGLVIVIIKYFS